LFYRLNILKYDFYVFPDVFLVHWHHNHSDWLQDSKSTIQHRWRMYFASISELKNQLEEGEVIDTDVDSSFEEFFKRHDEAFTNASVFSKFAHNCPADKQRLEQELNNHHVVVKECETRLAELKEKEL